MKMYFNDYKLKKKTTQLLSLTIPRVFKVTILHKAANTSKKRLKNCMLVKFCFFTNSLISTVKRAGIHRHCHQHCVHTVFFYTSLSPYIKAVTLEVLTWSVKWSVVAGVEWGLLWARGQMERESYPRVVLRFLTQKAPLYGLGFHAAVFDCTCSPLQNRL